MEFQPLGPDSECESEHYPNSNEYCWFGSATLVRTNRGGWRETSLRAPGPRPDWRHSPEFCPPRPPGAGESPDSALGPPERRSAAAICPLHYFYSRMTFLGSARSFISSSYTQEKKKETTVHCPKNFIFLVGRIIWKLQKWHMKNSGMVFFYLDFIHIGF